MSDFEQLNSMSELPKTWIFDLDGTVVYHRPYNTFLKDELLPGFKEFYRRNILPQDYVLFITARTNRKLRTRLFLWRQGIRYNKIIFGLPCGERILFNDIKPRENLKTAYAFNLKRNKGFEEFRFNL
jgi:hypothetical protein